MEKNGQNSVQPYDMDALRERVKAEMTRQNITSQKLAEMTRNSKGTVDNFLNTSTIPAFDRVCAICSALGISLTPPPDEAEEAQPEPSYGSEYVPDMKIMHQRELDAMTQSAAATLDALARAHAAENAAREKHLKAEQKEKRIWRAVALIFLGLLVAFCAWFVWDVTNGGRGIIRYGRMIVSSLTRG